MYSMYEPVHRIKLFFLNWKDLGSNLESGIIPGYFYQNWNWNPSREELGVEMENGIPKKNSWNENQTSSYVFTNFHSRVQFLTF